jgi:hypothetical protein
MVLNMVRAQLATCLLSLLVSPGVDAWSDLHPRRPIFVGRHRVQASSAASAPNTALVFIKPHAGTENTSDMVKTKLKNAGCIIESESVITSQEIEVSLF